jgi:hypothetical protein
MPLLPVAAGRESSDAAAFWQYAAEDHDATVAGGTDGPQSGADFDHGAELEREMFAESFGKKVTSMRCAPVSRETGLHTASRNPTVEMKIPLKRSLIATMLLCACLSATRVRAQATHDTVGLPQCAPKLIDNGISEAPGPSAPIPIPVNQQVNVIPTAPYTFSIPVGCTQWWVVKYDCTIQFFAGPLATQVIFPDMGYGILTVAPNTSQMFHWSDTIQFQEGTSIPAAMCAMQVNEPSRVIGNIVVEALPELH